MLGVAEALDQSRKQPYGPESVWVGGCGPATPTPVRRRVIAQGIVMAVPSGSPRLRRHRRRRSAHVTSSGISGHGGQQAPSQDQHARANQSGRHLRGHEHHTAEGRENQHEELHSGRTRDGQTWQSRVPQDGPQSFGCPTGSPSVGPSGLPSRPPSCPDRT